MTPLLKALVEMKNFEISTSCVQGRRSTVELHPHKSGHPSGRQDTCMGLSSPYRDNFGLELPIRTEEPRRAAGLANRCIRPLCQPEINGGWGGLRSHIRFHTVKVFRTSSPSILRTQPYKWLASRGTIPELFVYETNAAAS